MQIYALLAKRTLWSSQAILPVLAFAASSALFLTVAGGVQALSTWLDHANVDHELVNLMGIQKLYMGLAWVAALVLIVPLFTLGASAARLSARRRDERLASLRLIGASTTLIVGLSVADALVYSLVGFIIGLLLYLVLIFPFGALHFMNVPLGAENMLLPVSVIFYCFLGCMVLAALSSLFGLAKVSISPLGVRTRAKAGSAGYIALGIGVVLVIAVMILASTSKGFSMFSPFQDGGADSAIKNLAIFIALPGLLMMVAIDLIGTFLVWAYAKIRVRMTQKASVLLGYRAVLESPRGAWRQVSGVALSTFLVTFFGPILILAGEMSKAAKEAGPAAGPFMTIMSDMFQGMLLMLFFSYLLVTLSAVLNQSAAIYERGSLYSSLNMMGTPTRMLQASRLTVVFGPLVLISVVSALLGLPLTALIAAQGLSGEILTKMFGMTFGAIALGLALVYVGLLATIPFMRQVTHKPVSAL